MPYVRRNRFPLSRRWRRRLPYRRSARPIARLALRRVNRVLNNQELKLHIDPFNQILLDSANSFDMNPSGHLMQVTLHDNIPQGSQPQQRIGQSVNPTSIDIRIELQKFDRSSVVDNLPWNYRIVLVLINDDTTPSFQQLFNADLAPMPYPMWQDINTGYSQTWRTKKKVLYDKTFNGTALNNDKATSSIHIKRKIPRRYTPQYVNNVANRKIVLYFIGGPAATMSAQHPTLRINGVSRLNYKDT